MSTKTKLRAATVGGTADDIEAAFYEALQRGDVDALMDCWADEDEIFCVHPGGPRLVGADAIRAAFEQMFGNGAIHATPARVRKVESLASAVHNVLERIEVLTAEGPAPCLRAGHQRLSQDRAGLAHGRPPRQPGQRAGAGRHGRRAADALH